MAWKVKVLQNASQRLVCINVAVSMRTVQMHTHEADLEAVEEELSCPADGLPIAGWDEHSHLHQGIYTPACMSFGEKVAITCMPSLCYMLPLVCIDAFILTVLSMHSMHVIISNTLGATCLILLWIDLIDWCSRAHCFLVYCT